MTNKSKNSGLDSVFERDSVDSSKRNLIKGAGMVGVAALGTSAVSYTHLTLPTKA